MWDRQLQTHRRLWAVVALVLFVVLGCVNWVPESKGSVPYWVVWLIFLSGEYHCSTADIVMPLVLLTAMLATPAIAFGWVIQAIAGVLTRFGLHQW